MAECIVDTFGIVQDFADLHGDMNTPLYQAIMDVMVSRQREEIVRCIDCRFSIAGGFGCVKWSNFENARPKGFCAWGERREP